MALSMSPPAADAVPQVETRLVYAHGLAAIVTLLISVTFGIVASLELLMPDMAGNRAWMSWRRSRYDNQRLG